MEHVTGILKFVCNCHHELSLWSIFRIEAVNFNRKEDMQSVEVMMRKEVK